MDHRLKKLKVLIRDPVGASNLLSLLDTFNDLALDLDYPDLRHNKHINSFLKIYKKIKADIGGYQVKPEDFQVEKYLGKGAYGKVNLVRHRASKHVFAMKSLHKKDIVRKGKVPFVWVERDIMAFNNSPWIVQLMCSFHDKYNLHMVMEYLPSGDLHHLIKKNKLSEDSVKFYIAELVLSLHDLHSMGYIHRDVKPTNILLDRNGHIKLSDFGISIKMDSLGIVFCDRMVGTAEYLSPEVINSHEVGGRYGRECDWWAIGVITYEMLMGLNPFSGTTNKQVFKNIKNYEKHLSFPSDKMISEEAKDFICALLTSREDRLGFNSVEQIKVHSFFSNDQWTFDTIHKAAAPVQKFHEHFECKHKNVRVDHPLNLITKKYPRENINKMFPSKEASIETQLLFVGFTYFKKDWLQRKCSNLEEVLDFAEKVSSVLSNASKTISDLQKETEKLQRPNMENKKKECEALPIKQAADNLIEITYTYQKKKQSTFQLFRKWISNKLKNKKKKLSMESAPSLKRSPRSGQ